MRARVYFKISNASRRTKKPICGGIWYVQPFSSAKILTNNDQVAYARCHLDWARKNLETWTEAKDEVDKIVAR